MVLTTLLTWAATGCEVAQPTVTGVAAVTITTADLELFVGASAQVDALVDAAEGATALDWTVADPDTATVAPAETMTDRPTTVVTALAPGTTTVTATSRSDSTMSDDLVVTVVPFGATLWAHQFEHEVGTSARGVAVDATGTVYVTGTTGGNLADIHTGGVDAYVRAIDRQRGVVWTRQFGLGEDGVINAIAASHEGNLAVAGSISSDLGGTSVGPEDAFVRSFHPNGDHRWITRFGDVDIDEFASVAIDPDGRVYAAGHSALDSTVPPFDGTSGIVFAYAANGGLRWAYLIEATPASSRTHARAIAVGGDGIVAAAGQTSGTLTRSPTGGSDAFVRAYDVAGNHLWTRQFGSLDRETATAVAVDAGGNVIVAGSTWGALGEQHVGMSDAFVRVYDRDGAVRWTHQFGTDREETVRGVAVDRDGAIVVLGTTTGALAGDPIGPRDLFVRKLAPDGTPLWTRQFGTDRHDSAGGIAVHDDRTIVVVGATTGTIIGEPPPATTLRGVVWQLAP